MRQNDSHPLFTKIFSKQPLHRPKLVKYSTTLISYSPLPQNRQLDQYQNRYWPHNSTQKHETYALTSDHFIHDTFHITSVEEYTGFAAYKVSLHSQSLPLCTYEELAQISGIHKVSLHILPEKYSL